MRDWKTRGPLLLACIGIGMFVAIGLRAGRAGAPDPAPSSTPPPAAHPQMDMPPGDATALLVDLGNKLCPINGGEVDGETSVEWNHMRVNFCCAGCDTKFLSDPEGALDKAGIEWRPLRDAIGRFEEAPAEHKQHQLEAIRKHWTVIREPAR